MQYTTINIYPYTAEISQKQHSAWRTKIVPTKLIVQLIPFQTEKTPLFLQFYDYRINSQSFVVFAEHSITAERKKLDMMSTCFRLGQVA